MLLFNHAPGLFAGRSKRLSRLGIAEIDRQIIKQTVCRNNITISVAFGGIPKRWQCLLKRLLVTQSNIRIPSDLFRAFLGFRQDAAGVPSSLGEKRVRFLTHFLGSLNCQGAFIGRKISCLFQPYLRVCAQTGCCFQGFGKLPLRLCFGVAELFVFPKRLKIL